jgi:phosphotransferase system HPr (HPr) family protein
VEPLDNGVATASADGRSILSVLSLGIKSGTTIRVTIEGDDAEALANDLKELLADPNV